MSKLLDRVLTLILGVAALGFLVVLVHREFYSPQRRLPVAASVFVSSWRDVLPAGRLVGDPTSPVTLVEFTDLECPFCRRFNTDLQNVLAAHPKQVNYVFVHLPLSMHRFASPAAHAVECASRFGRFREAVDAIFAKQDSLGLKSWTSFARDAGVADSSAFAACVVDKAPDERVAAGRSIAAKLGIHGTPTIMLNGWKYGAPPADTELSRAISDILSGRPPYPGFQLTHP